MRFFSELRSMIWGIMHSIASLVWAMLVLMMVMIVSSCFITQTVSTELIEHAEGRGTLSEEDIAHLTLCYRNIWVTNYSLYKAITGGADWESFADVLFKISPIAGVFFCFYIAF